MKILAVNAGSSSLKVQLLEMPSEKLIAKALVERIKAVDSIVTIKYEDGKVFSLPSTPISDHKEAVALIASKFTELKIIEDINEIKGVAHRVVQGGEYFSKTEIVTDAFHSKPEKNQLHVSSTRCGSVPGTHKVFFDSPADTIELTHTARSRQGFASGAVHALENLKKYLDNGTLKPGMLYGMKDVFPGVF